MVIRRWNKRKDQLIIVLLNDEEKEWFESIVRFHAVSDEGVERDQKVLDRLDELVG